MPLRRGPVVFEVVALDGYDNPSARGLEPVRATLRGMDDVDAPSLPLIVQPVDERVVQADVPSRTAVAHTHAHGTTCAAMWRCEIAELTTKGLYRLEVSAGLLEASAELLAVELDVDAERHASPTW